MRRKIIIYFSLFIYHFSFVNAQDGTWFWSTEGIGNGDVETVASDRYGNCYMTGLFQNDTIHFGSHTVMNSTVTNPPFSSDEDAYLVKFAPNGDILWATQTFEKNRNPNTGGNDNPESVCTDKWGNVYLSGNFIDTLFIGSYTFITKEIVTYAQSLYLAKYNSNGSLLWAKQAACVSDSSIVNEDGISCDNLGNIYLVGIFSDTISFGGDIITTPTASTGNMVLVKYDSNGIVKWTRQPIDIKQGVAQGWAVTNDQKGNTFVTGDFNDSVKFGSYKLGTLNSDDFFIAKYDSAGNVLWAKQATIPSNSSSGLGRAITTDQTGNVYVAGDIADTMIFGDDTLIGPGNYLYQYTFFLVKYDLNGNVLWAEQAMVKDDNSWQVGFGGLSIDNSKHLYLSAGGGQGVNGIVFAGVTLSMNDTAKYDGVSVIFKLDSDGNAVCSSIIPIGTAGGYHPPVASDTSGSHVYLGAIARSIGVFGKDTVNPLGYPINPIQHGNTFPFVARWEECDSNVLYAGVNEVKVESEKVKVYPNPNNGLFTIVIASEAKQSQSKIEVYNVLGEQVYNATLNQVQGDNNINLSSQPSGIYFYRVITESGLASGEMVGEGKVVIQK